MQSDYVSAFGIGGLISDNGGTTTTTTRTSNANNGLMKKTSQANNNTTTENETVVEYNQRRGVVTVPTRRTNQMYSKSSTMIAPTTTTTTTTTPTTITTSPTSLLESSTTKRTRFNSVETPPTTNTSSSSTDTVTPLHGLAAKAATAVLRRSQSIKQAAQAKRKSALRSLSHTLPSHHHHHHYHHNHHASTNANDDQYELDDLRIKYESFCNRDEDENDEDQDADVEDVDDEEDEDDEPDENESLLHSSKAPAQSESFHHQQQQQQQQQQPPIKDINNNLDTPNITLQNNINNNTDESLRVVIVNSNGTIPGATSGIDSGKVAAALKTAKRSDSVRMRHHSNISTANMGNADGGGGSSSSRLKKYFKCRKNKVRSKASQRRHNYLVIFLLFVVNLLNYIDRYTLAGVLLDVQDYFGINDGESGLLQTVFICSYMLLAPLFGYMGDRYSRKWIIIFGITFWSLMTFLGSLVPANKFWLFALIRSLVGIGEASYSCVAPTIIGDLFTNEMRTKMLAVFYLAVPVGSGLGYIVGSNVANAFHSWKWALRVTPPLGFICVLLLVFVVQEPKRGGAESGNGNGNENDMGASRSNIKDDVIYLLKNKTFMWITFGFTFASFVLGGLSWWVPAYVQYAIYSNNKIPDQIPLKFGVVTCISGLFGVAMSSVLAEKLRKKTPNADPLVCALGSLIAVPSLFVLILMTGAVNEALFWMIAAIAISAMCLSWTIVADVLLYAIYPHRRSIASALNILICHLFGDAGSPYVIGAISDAFRKGKPDTYYSKFSSLQVALYAGPFFAALSFAAYLFTAIYVVEDKKDVDDFIRRSKQMNEAINGSGEEGNDKNFTSSNESTLNEASSSRSKKVSEHTSYLNPVAFTQEMGTTNELQSSPK